MNTTPFSKKKTPTQAKPSKVEKAKEGGRFLRGTVAETLAGDKDRFSPDDVQLLKFHGVYQQDDRDLRKERRKKGLGKHWQFMMRVALPAGIMTAGQYLRLDQVADRLADGSLRITTRQGIQFHGVLKGDLKAAVAEINDSLMTTLGACGDVERNVMACPAPIDDPAHRAVQELAEEISRQLRPRSGAYHEIWIDGEKTVSTKPPEPAAEEEDFYGATYLPRKLKTGVALENDNCIDIFSYDVGLVGMLEDDEIVGYNLLVGGGLGMTHNKPETVARLAEPLGYVEPGDAVEAVRTVAAIFRDHGNRSNRRQARLKYLLERWGLERFRREFERRAPFRLQPPRQMGRLPFHDHLGTQRQGDGRWFYGLFVQNGRITDREGKQLRTALRRIVQELSPGVHATAQQSLLLTGLDLPSLERVKGLLREHGVEEAGQLTQVRRHSMACPALPTCGLALGESERLLPSVLQELERELDELGLKSSPLTVRMTGCPNGCARPYTADLAFVARSPSTYHVFVGGRLEGDRIADLFAADVKPRDFLETLRPLLRLWSSQRRRGESLGDFYQRRLGDGSHRRRITGKEEPTQARLHSLEVAL
ncbi:MAG TPA: NADPH-dependent assimilatory sulfite reductase hemoprotein subunit [Acidobacteriota bacterium]|nr:NADPH-dependent assimilatory sulfite reductase hemoprotein subunit [Acidobacteriota bacterium]